jgi:AraC-like DNA-binding protein
LNRHSARYRIVVLMLGGRFGISSDLSYFIIPVYFYSAYTYLAISMFIVWRFKISYSPVLDTQWEHCSPVESDTANVKIQKVDLKIIEQVKHAMESDKLYLRNKLTVSDLANHISSQEYRVRRAINIHLQYRNFSDFVNHYRILEAERRLLETDDPISTIGFEVGYSLLSGFFKAFKEKYLITPKEYRIRHQAA